MDDLFVNREKRRGDALNQLHRDTRVAAGEKLPNGAILIQEKQSKSPGTGITTIVLAVHPGFQPFIVWERVRTLAEMPDGKFVGRDFCIHGDYHQHLYEATDAYAERQ